MAKVCFNFLPCQQHSFCHIANTTFTMAKIVSEWQIHFYVPQQIHFMPHGNFLFVRQYQTSFITDHGKFTLCSTTISFSGLWWTISKPFFSQRWQIHFMCHGKFPFFWTMANFFFNGPWQIHYMDHSKLSFSSNNRHALREPN